MGSQRLPYERGVAYGDIIPFRGRNVRVYWLAKEGVQRSQYPGGPWHQDLVTITIAFGATQFGILTYTGFADQLFIVIFEAKRVQRE